MIRCAGCRGCLIGIESLGHHFAQRCHTRRFAQIGADDQVSLAERRSCGFRLLLVLNHLVHTRQPRQEIRKRCWHDVCDLCFAYRLQEESHSQTATHRIAVRILVSDDGDGLCIIDATCCMLELKR